MPLFSGAELPLRFVKWACCLLFALHAVACGAEEGNGAAAEPVAAAKVEPGVITGTATTSEGKPITSFAGTFSGYSLKSGQTLTTNIDGANGVYRMNVGAGQFAGRAWTDVEYNGRQYRIDLHPVDGKVARHKYETTDGLQKDFVWKLDGFRPGADERSTDRFYSHYGGSIDLNPEGHGVAYWSGIKGDHQHAPEPKLPIDSTVELTLTPDGPLIDGSTGKVVVLTLKPANIKGYMDRKTRGIPIGKYNATAKVLFADGSSKPLKVTLFYSGSKAGEPAAPAESAVLEFEQRNAPSENVNNVNEVSIHVML